MCSEGWDNGEAVVYCPDCEFPVDEDGDAVSGCCHSPINCETCGSSPCDGSC